MAASVVALAILTIEAKSRVCAPFTSHLWKFQGPDWSIAAIFSLFDLVVLADMSLINICRQISAKSWEANGMWIVIEMSSLRTVIYMAKPS